MAGPDSTAICSGLGDAMIEALCRQQIEGCEGSWADDAAKAYCVSSATTCAEQKKGGGSSFALTMPNGGRIEVQSLQDCFQTAARITGVFWSEASREPPAAPASPASGLADEGQCQVKATNESKVTFDPLSMSALSEKSEPDVNGDGVADLLVPMTTNISWDGNSADVCRRLLKPYFTPAELSGKSLLKGEAVLNDRFYAVHALSTKRMEGAAGNDWRGVAQAYNGGVLMAGAAGYLLSSSGLLSLDRLVEGLTVSDIVTSQLSSAFSVPVTDGGRSTDVRIGTIVQITFTKEVPETLKAFPRDGNAVEARVIDFNPTFRKLPDGRMELAKEFLRIDIVPPQYWGEAWNVMRMLELYTTGADDGYRIEVNGIPAHLPE